MKDTFRTLLAEKYHNDEKIEKILANIQNRLEKRLPEGVEPTLTKFQKQVISEQKFWRDWGPDAEIEHLMIQGATSAGKTLLSELAILDALHHNQKAIVLVPLKAMVRERTAQFREDMNNGLAEYEIQVYGSSSDNMENDERLINGIYEVANIVYEKFFAMLSQGQAKIMDDCSLLVVDELSMLGAGQRGPKLEMALEIVRKKYPKTRIMCMATCDCSTEKICKWLNISEPIVSTARPVALEEHIIELNGDGIYRMIPADHESDQQDAPERMEEKIDVPGYDPNWWPHRKEQELLISVMKKMYEENPDARVLVFTSTQAKASKTADFLKENVKKWSPDSQFETKQRYDEDFLASLAACDRDEGQEKLIEDLIPNGIAYHHAGISTTLRELIEEQFSKPQSGLRVIVATETLTIGVNMPFDTMIMTSCEVPRGVNKMLPLTQQEYRNFIGRAGRLGQSNRIGKTYLFVDNQKYRDLYWNSYFNRDEVRSALTDGDEEILAPYYLSILNNKISNAVGTKFTLSLLDTVFEESLSKVCGRKKPFDAGKLHYNLYKAYLATDAQQKIGARSRGTDAEMEYALEDFGQHMAPYALSIDTCIRIFWYFYEGYRHNAMPLNLSQRDIESDRFLLDILYHVCCHQEIVKSSNLVYPTDDSKADRPYKAKRKVLSQLRQILAETDEEGNKKNVLWCDLYNDSGSAEKDYSDIWMLLNSSNLRDETLALQAAMRAIVLFYWTKGYSTAEIRKITEFHNFTKVITGDIERLAEVTSFHLDAIQKCLKYASDPETGDFVYEDAHALKEFYALQTRVKYGMPRDLVVFANKHIHGLDRKRLLDLKQKAKEAGLTPMQYLYITPPGKIPASILTLSQQAQLRQALERRSSVKNIDTLMEIIENDLGNDMTSEDMACMREISAWKGYNEEKTPTPEVIYQNLKKLRENSILSSIGIFTDCSPCNIVWTAEGKELHFGVLYSRGKNEEVLNFFKEKALTKILIVPDDFTEDEKTEAMKTYGANALFDNVFLSFMLAKTICTPLDSGQILTEFLADLRGIFTKTDYNFFPLLNYKKCETDTAPRFRVIFGSSFCRKEENALNAELICAAFGESEDLQNYEVLPWGSNLVSGTYSFTECPTVILLNRRDITRSESLTQFMHIMRNQNFANCILLLESDVEEQEWDSADTLEEYGRLRWNHQLNKVRKMITPDTTSILQKTRELLHEWKHQGYLIGISYCHYDPQASEIDSEHKNDIDLLCDLAVKLRIEYGEDRILFDQFSPAKTLFTDNKSKEKSLTAYGECRYYIVLWNFWTKENQNCQNERDVILKRCEDDSCKCIFLQTGQKNDPDPPDRYFTVEMSAGSLDTLFKTIKDQIDDLLAEG